jgi:hypothetical protein
MWLTIIWMRRTITKWHTTSNTNTVVADTLLLCFYCQHILLLLLRAVTLSAAFVDE